MEITRVQRDHWIDLIEPFASPDTEALRMRSCHPAEAEFEPLRVRVRAQSEREGPIRAQNEA